MAWSSTTFSFAFKVSPPIARSSTTSLRTTPTIVRLSQFTKKSSLDLSSSHTISGFSPIPSSSHFSHSNPPISHRRLCKRLQNENPQGLSLYLCRFRVTGSGKIMRRRAGKQHLLRKKNTKRKLRLTALDCGYKLDSSFQPSQPSPTSVSPSANAKA
ncbi:hypothetical protein TEA_009438 [Camellia sinensis var. sinensis]|uniref:50S ribosomal protein L35 n=1 Tax=Camellia sinensis var. sinensis TaxID=542762 RepID=A0A4S4ESZ3_CAMSN|nr:hypothetical protein TEA_009438 [Camellia sinensis var. sinensis]